jgi:hypothetical protein
VRELVVAELDQLVIVNSAGKESPFASKPAANVVSAAPQSTRPIRARFNIIIISHP